MVQEEYEVCPMASFAFSRALCPPRAVVRGLLLALSVGGCSADVTRFDFPAFDGSSRPTGALPTPPEPIYPRTAGYSRSIGDGPAPSRGAGFSDAPPERSEASDWRAPCPSSGRCDPRS